MTEFSSVSLGIETLQVIPLSDEDIQRRSHVEVVNTKQIENGESPYEGGLYDAAMGGQFGYDCNTCQQPLNKCVGHFGSFTLSTPVITYLYEKLILKWLRIICRKCYRIIFDVDIKNLYPTFDVNRIRESSSPIKTLFAFFGALLKSREKKIFCDHCNNIKSQVESGVVANNKFLIDVIQWQYKTSAASEYFIDRLKNIPSSNSKTYTRAPDFSGKDILIPADVLAIFECLSDSEIIKIGLPVTSHPRNYITRNLLIPPVNMRYINNSNTRSEGNNYMTSNIDAIIKASDQLGSAEINKDDNFTRPFQRERNQFSNIENLIQAYNNYLGVGSYHDKVTGIYSGFKGKEGLYRASGLGRVISNNICRAVISCMPKLRIDEIEMPRYFAHAMYIQETVTPYNIEYLRTFVNNRDIYPGCSKIKRMDEFGNDRLIQNNGLIEIQPGDIVFRNPIDSDPILMNRSPSLSTTSYTMMKSVINKDKSDINDFRMNVISCGMFNADFDGDQMMGKFVNEEAAREEAHYLMSVPRFFTRFENGELVVGLVQDSAVGCALLTTYGVILSRYEVMKIMANIPISQKLDKETYTGREVFSMVMPSINYEEDSQMFKEKLIKIYGNYHESDYRVVIKKGKLLSGIVCSKAVKGKMGGIYHVIASSFGNQVALDTIFYHQQMTARFLALRGFTISYKDIRLSSESKKMIELVQSGVMREVNEFNNKLMAGMIRPPQDIPLADHVENEMARILSSGTKYLPAILDSLDIQDNGLIQLVASGTKGSFGNIGNIFAPVGQLQIDGKRIENTLGYNRFGINSRQFSLHPSDRGYVSNSYITGFSPKETLAAGLETRKNILTKGLVVAEAGFLAKLIIRAVESAVVDSRLWTVRGYGEDIIEFNCTDDNFKSCNSQLNYIEVVFMSNADIKKHYPGREKMMQDSRDWIIDQNIRIKNLNPRYEISKNVFLPIDIGQIISSTIGGGEEKAETNWKLLDDFCDNLHYLRVNNLHKIKKTPMMNWCKEPFMMLGIALRSAFKKDIISQYSEDGFKLLLNVIMNKIRASFYTSGDAIGILLGQAFSAPLTQYLIDAHHASAVGGTSKEKLNYCMGIIQKKDVDQSQVNIMYIYIKPEYEQDKEVADKLAEFITSKKLHQVLNKSEIVYEGPGIHDVYPNDKKFSEKYLKQMNITIVPNDHHRLKMRLTIDNHRLVSNSINIDDLITKIEFLYGKDLVPVNASDPDSEQSVILIYFNLGFNWIYISSRADRLKKHETEKDPSKIQSVILTFFKKFNNHTTINEFKDITSVKVIKTHQMIVKNGDLEKYEYYYIETSGINMIDILLINIVDSSRTGCNNVMETYRFSGIAATQLRITSELNNVLGADMGNLPAVYAILANIMLSTGRPSAISDSGFSDREPNDILLRMSIKSPMDWIGSAGSNSATFKSLSPSSDIVLGQAPRYIGTARNMVILDTDFIKENSKVKKSRASEL